MQYQDRYAGVSLPPRIQDDPNRARDERWARIQRMLASVAPLAGGAIGAGVGALTAGPGAGLAGAKGGLQVGAGLGQGVGAVAGQSAEETMAPHTLRDLERDERRRRIALMLGSI